MHEENDLIPDETALAHSEALQSLMRREIAQSGPLPFDRFMELALYAPGLGYYTAGSQKFGSTGDFVTAPEISPLFSRCLANQCAQVLQITGGDILEFGAGSGIMAADILARLELLSSLPGQYCILDLSPDLRERQRCTIEAKVPHLLGLVKWLDELPQQFTGVVLGNEVLDAMPVTVFKKQGKNVVEQYVDDVDGQLQPVWNEAGDCLNQDVKSVENRYAELPEGYVSEINQRLSSWLKTLSEKLLQGVIILVDYGYTGFEYYHPDRSMGTLICHYRHRAHDDPFKLIGLQDITANVDFSAVKISAQQAGLNIAGFTTQANFLMANGLEDLLAEYNPEDAATFMPVTQGVKVLMLPSEMGERFKVIALAKNFNESLQGFRFRNLQERL